MAATAPTDDTMAEEPPAAPHWCHEVMRALGYEEVPLPLRKLTRNAPQCEHWVLQHPQANAWHPLLLTFNSPGCPAIYECVQYRDAKPPRWERMFATAVEKDFVAKLTAHTEEEIRDRLQSRRQWLKYASKYAAEARALAPEDPKRADKVYDAKRCVEAAREYGHTGDLDLGL